MIWQKKEISEPCEIHDAKENGDMLRVVALLDRTAQTMLVSVTINSGSGEIKLTIHPGVEDIQEAKEIAQKLYDLRANELRALLAYAQTRWP
jgi:hypothetical protein